MRRFSFVHFEVSLHVSKDQVYSLLPAGMLSGRVNEELDASADRARVFGRASFEGDSLKWDAEGLVKWSLF